MRVAQLPFGTACPQRAQMKHRTLSAACEPAIAINPPPPHLQASALLKPNPITAERSLLVAPPSSSGKPPTKPVIAAPGASPLLSRLQNFLPAMQTANQDLLHLPPASLSMELEGLPLLMVV